MSWQLESKDLVLTLPDGEKDADALYELFKLEQVVKAYPRPAMVVSAQALDELRRIVLRFDTREAIFWMIREKESGDFVGRIGFERANWMHANANIVVDIMPEKANDEWLVQAGNAFFSFVFEQLQLHRLQALICAEDTALFKFCEVFKFTHEGVQPAAQEYNQQWIDYQVYSILATEF